MDYLATAFLILSLILDIVIIYMIQRRPKPMWSEDDWPGYKPEDNMARVSDQGTYDFKNDGHISAAYQLRSNPPRPLHFHWYSSGKDIEQSQWEFRYRILKTGEDASKTEWRDIIIRHGHVEKNVWQIVDIDSWDRESFDMIQYTLKFKCADKDVRVVATGLEEV